MMIVALVLFAVVILACLVAPSGTKAKKPAEVPAPAAQPSLNVSEARA
jgi:hypothetical protein